MIWTRVCLSRFAFHKANTYPSDFKSKEIRINLNQPIKADVKAESSEVLKAVDDDRKYVIQTTIVRIMKLRKTMKNQRLIQEVISQISQRFVPEIPDIQKVSDPCFLCSVSLPRFCAGHRNTLRKGLDWA